MAEALRVDVVACNHSDCASVRQSHISAATKFNADFRPFVLNDSIKFTTKSVHSDVHITFRFYIYDKGRL